MAKSGVTFDYADIDASEGDVLLIRARNVSRWVAQGLGVHYPRKFEEILLKLTADLNARAKFAAADRMWLTPDGLDDDGRRVLDHTLRDFRLSGIDLPAEQIARQAMAIAADICVYTNGNLTVEILQGRE